MTERDPWLATEPDLEPSFGFAAYSQTVRRSGVISTIRVLLVGYRMFPFGSM